ncbi:MAG: hypothetical protein II984_05545 [Clostridia bacterium]|nr:hypothetical protein [Clostridia bacterium]
MSQENFIKNNIELQKKMLNDYKQKIKKNSGTVSKIAIAMIVLNIIFLFAIPFASINGEKVSMFEAFDSSYESVSTLKFFYIISWIATVVIAIATIVSKKNGDDMYAWIKPNLIASLINLICSIALLLTHMTAETEVFYGNSTCFLWWIIPFIASFIYVFIPIMGYVYKKYIPLLEKNVREFEKE